MKKFFASLLLSAAVITSPVQAKEALWSAPGNWRVTGWTEGHCAASVNLGSMSFGMGIVGDGIYQISIAGTNGIEGQRYRNTFVAGEKTATVIGQSYVDGVITYDFMPSDMIVFARSKKIYISDMGWFDMTGSMHALADMIDCYRAMKGIGA